MIKKVVLNDNQLFPARLLQHSKQLGPVSPFPAFKFGEKSEDPLAMYLADICSVIANLTRTPAISIPGRPTKDGLPVGIQLMGQRYRDQAVLGTATALQEITDYHLKRPC